MQSIGGVVQLIIMETTMNMQGLQYSTPITTKRIARPLCLCEEPDIQTTEGPEHSAVCDNCGKNVNASNMKAAKKMMLMKELREIEEAKTNIRNTLRLQQKRNSERAEELEFLLKRL